MACTRPRSASANRQPYALSGEFVARVASRTRAAGEAWSFQRTLRSLRPLAPAGTGGDWLPPSAVRLLAALASAEHADGTDFRLNTLADARDLGGSRSSAARYAAHLQAEQSIVIQTVLRRVE